MFAARDQENLVHARQTTAAAKPLNQGVRQLQPKTPGNKVPKTPFKIPLNDENDPLHNGSKTGLKAKGREGENFLQSGKKDGGASKNAFVTPMGPRNRAPLGMKTTNAKSKAFQTPAAPVENATKPQKRSSTRKAKIHHDPVQTEVAGQHDIEAEYPEPEYMPPTPTALPDPPMDIPYDTSFPQFRPENMARGYWDEYANRKGPDGLTDWDRQDRKEQAEHVKRVDAMIQKVYDEMEIPGWNVRAFPDEESVMEREARVEAEEKAKVKAETQDVPIRNPLRRPPPSTLRSRTAVSVLSQPSKPAITTKPVRPTPAPRSKVPAFLSSTKPTPNPTNPSPMRHTASTAASRQTLGYSKGRSVSGALRPSILASKTGNNAATSKESGMGMPDYSKLSVDEYVRLRGTPPVGSDMWFRAHDLGYFDSATDALEGKPAVSKAAGVGFEDLFKGEEVVGEEDEEVFQLSLEGLGFVE